MSLTLLGHKMTSKFARIYSHWILPARCCCCCCWLKIIFATSLTSFQIFLWSIFCPFSVSGSAIRSNLLPLLSNFSHRNKMRWTLFLYPSQGTILQKYATLLLSTLTEANVINKLLSSEAVPHRNKALRLAVLSYMTILTNQSALFHLFMASNRGLKLKEPIGMHKMSVA